MGLRDKLTGLREQAQEAVAEHKDQIQGAMETAGSAVDRKTHGKYTDKIAKYGQKATDAVENFADQASDEQGADRPDGTAAAGPQAAS
jgi:MT0933-like antitoxin protein